jgi:cytochrome b subunit of formate dehydrogenase
MTNVVRAPCPSMTRGTVDKRWASTHHPVWYSSATGRSLCTDDEAPVQRRAGDRADGGPP